MKVTEIVYDSRKDETFEVSWGDNITSDMSLVVAVANIVEHQRARENGLSRSPFAKRLTTIGIHISLEDSND